MRSLVLGGNGFLGSHLVDALVARGDQVSVVGLAPTPYDPHLLTSASARVKYYQGNFADISFLTPLLAETDVIFHLVSTTIPATSNQNPIADIQGNLVATIQLLEALRHLPHTRLIYFSSGGTVYGTPQHIPIPENHPLEPKSSYGIVKMAVEKYLHMYAELYGVQSVILRLANPYGPRQSKIGVQGFIATVLMKALLNQPISIWGNGDVIRDYIYVDDVIRLLLMVTNSDEVGTFNVGSGEGYSLSQILEVAQNVTQRQILIDRQEARNFDVPAVILDIRKVCNAFVWSPQVTLEEGMTKHWQWMKTV